ncbi:trichohyalin isoform X2 [Hydra vulgaris]|uniref:Trichohyalin isoform X2 n=1 Tax=Hydra vulgaris TaxID=6087 RepID=A0ABM4C4R5_HYDVU
MLSGDVTDRIGDLTESLNRTTEILSTADRMMDHYRNLNREQEFEIARLQEDLQSRNRIYKRNYKDCDSDFSKKKKKLQQNVKKVYLTSSESSEDELHLHKRSFGSKVKFKNKEDDILETTLSELNKRQEHLEKELKREKKRRAEEIEQLDQLVSIKKELTSTRRKDEAEEILDKKLTFIQNQLEEERWEWKKHQKGISDEVQSIKEIIKESVTPKSIEKSSKPVWRDSEDCISHYKRKIEKGEEMIRKLKDELHIKSCENRVFETTVDEIYAVDQMKASQLQLLKDQLQNEKSSKSKIIEEYEKLKNELAANDKQRRELLIDLSTIKNETQTFKHNYEEEINRLKRLLDKNEKSKQKLLSRNEKFEFELNNKELLLQQKNHQLNDFADRIANLEKEKQDWHIKSKDAQYHADLKKDLESTKLKLIATQQSCKDLIKAKKALKEKAVSTIKDLRRKCSELEDYSSELLEENRQKNAEISKREESKDIEVNSLKLKKEMLKVKSLLMRLKDYQQKIELLTSEKNHLEGNLLNAREEAKLVTQYKKEVENLQEMVDFLKAKLLTAKQKRKGLKNLLEESYEVAVSKREETSLLLKQVEEKKSTYIHMVEKMQQKHDNEIKEMMKREEEKLKAMEKFYKKSEENFKVNEEKFKEKKLIFSEKESEWRALEKEYQSLLEERDKKLSIISENNQLLLEEKDKKLSTLIENNRLLLEEKEEKIILLEENSKVLLEEKIKLSEEKLFYEEKIKMELQKFIEENSLLNEKLLRLAEENLRIRKRYQLMKKDLVEKLNKALAIESKDQTSENSEEHFKLLLKSILRVLGRDVENIHKLLTKEVDENLPAKEIPEEMPNEYKNEVEHFQEHLHACYSISKVLKHRYQQQKMLIKRARIKIKSLMEEIESLRSQLKSEVISYKKKFLEMEKVQADEKLISEEYKKKAQVLQSRVKKLSNHLEKCTRALHGSIALASNQKFVIDEIDQLRNDHKEYQELDERFYKNEEKKGLISEQLSEAKNSLSQMKQDSLDTTIFSNKIIETFGSVSPTRKRKLLYFNSPNKITALSDKSNAQITYSDVEFSPIKDSVLLNDTELTINGGAVYLNPMSLTDEEFTQLFVDTKSNEKVKSNN